MQKARQDGRALEMALSAMPVAISWATLADQKIIFMNRKFTETFGYEVGDFANISEWIEKTYPFLEDRALVEEKWGASFVLPGALEANIDPIEIRILCKDGTLKTILNSGVILPETGWALATFVDISERKRDEVLIQLAAQRARENQAIYHLLLDRSPEMILLAPFDESRRFVSPAVQKVTGFSPAEYLALRGLEMVHVDDHPRAMRVIEGLKNGELSQVFRYRALQKDGGYCWVEAIVTGYVDPGSQRTAGYVATVRDITEQKEREELLASHYLQLAEEASLDELTGIANRRSFNRTFHLEALRQTRSSSALAVMLVDVDYFKQYNDLYGHLPGDACLKKIAETLKQLLRRDSDLVARFGGEEFVVLVPMTDPAGAEVIARNILQAVADLGIPHEANPGGVVTVSVGVACWSRGFPLDQVLLLEQADRALYQAKEAGRNGYFLIEGKPPSS
ncbi:diguanylate cyclase domain-containing protein [Terriglobus saanensis]|uniref:diguanylate cyclase n=1 Tax=Terriglobus saanensis (strain ATCC BAA-1853 / DSM 23119 / SP1PR4) TaxID=401053 RepID=E8UYP5_TERSS|nr:diguanylate cyclase [Terriglobus saanensis]ADV83198.1 diguanylate cyclase with PAS/PAC sensor [Terriglobus saanensis SP1PR4]